VKQLLNQRFLVPRSSAMAEVTEMAARYGDVINLSIGDPDIPTPRGIIQQVYEDALAGHTKYTDPRGYPELRQAIRDFYREEYGDQVEDQEVFVTASGVVGMYLAMQVLLDPGDEVIIPDPYFTCYADQVQAAGGVPVFLPTQEEEGFAIDLERLESLVTPRTKAVLINTPNNPTGACLSRKQLEQLAEFCMGHDLYVVADDIYTNFTYGEPFFPIRALPGMGERTITVNSFSKNFIMTGFRVGNIIAPAEVVRALKQMNEYVVYSAPALSQRGALWALRERARLEPPILQQFRERMEYAAKRINQVGWMTVPVPQGSIYLFPSIRRTGMTSAQVTRRILEEAHVLVLPGDTFGACGEGYLRIACTVENSVMGEAMDRIAGMSM
jgi:aspartate/methionine/tyrosine aminotransferase